MTAPRTRLITVADEAETFRLTVHTFSAVRDILARKQARIRWIARMGNRVRVKVEPRG